VDRARRATLSVEGIARAIGLGGIGLYVLGLLAVNVYLLAFGVTDFTILKPQLISTGALVLFPVLIAALWFSFGFAFVRSSPKYRWWRDLVRWLLAAIFQLVATWLVFLCLRLRAGSGIRHASNDALRLLWGPEAIVLLVWGIWVFVHSSQSTTKDALDLAMARWKRRHRPYVPVVMIGATIFLIVALAFYLSRVADDVYPVVPPQLGGGRPFDAQLLLTPEGRSQAKALHLTIDSVGLSSTVNVIYVGSEFYLLCFQQPPLSRLGPTDKAYPLRCIADGKITIVRVNASLVEALRRPEHGR
jgi:hypothetical protein